MNDSLTVKEFIENIPSKEEIESLIRNTLTDEEITKIGDSFISFLKALESSGDKMEKFLSSNVENINSFFSFLLDNSRNIDTLSSLGDLSEEEIENLYNTFSDDSEEKKELYEPYKKIDSFSILLAKYATAFFNEKNLSFPVRINTYKNKKVVDTAEVYLNITPSTLYQSVNFEKPLDEYDRVILNSIITIWISGARRFTPQNVYETMTGEKTTDSKKLIDIRERIMKMDNTRISLKLDELVRIYKGIDKKEDYNPIIVNSRVINVDNIRWVDENNKQTIQDGFIFLKEPTLYTVCKFYNNQITTVDSKYLKMTSGSVSNTFKTIPLKEYLLRRINVMKNGSVENTISFDTLYSENNFNTLDKVQLKRIRECTFSILDCWKHSSKEERLFKDYKVNMKGRSYQSITIIF